MARPDRLIGKPDPRFGGWSGLYAHTHTREGRFFGQRPESKQEDLTTENAEDHGVPRSRNMALRAMFDHTYAQSAQKFYCSVHSPWSSVFSVVRPFLAEGRAPLS
jgi:hypothetical protein